MALTELRGDRLGETAYEVARRTDGGRQGLTVREIESALNRQGYAPAGDNTYMVLRSALNRLQHLFELRPGGKWVWRDTPAYDPKEGLSGRALADAALAMAQSAGISERFHYEDVKVRLQVSGTAVRGPQPGGTINGALRNDPRFEHLGEGWFRVR